jgi:hypothetical protein
VVPGQRHLLVTGSSLELLQVVDSSDGSRRVLYSGPDEYRYPSLSPDGAKVACAIGSEEADAIEISIRDGRVLTLAGGGGDSRMPDSAPSALIT